MQVQHLGEGAGDVLDLNVKVEVERPAVVANFWSKRAIR